VLKPGGFFAGAAVLHGGPAAGWPGTHTPAAFAALLEAAGFTEVTVREATRDCWQAFLHKFNLYLWEQVIDGSFDGAMVEDAKAAVYGPLVPVHAYVVFRAKRPA